MDLVRLVAAKVPGHFLQLRGLLALNSVPREPTYPPILVL